jgi:hypothetical protein
MMSADAHEGVAVLFGRFAASLSRLLENEVYLRQGAKVYP